MFLLQKISCYCPFTSLARSEAAEAMDHYACVDISKRLEQLNKDLRKSLHDQRSDTWVLTRLWRESLILQELSGLIQDIKDLQANPDPSLDHVREKLESTCADLEVTLEETTKAFHMQYWGFVGDSVKTIQRWTS